MPKRVLAHSIALIVTVFLLLVTSFKMAKTGYVIWTLPYIVGNCAMAFYLVLSLSKRPKEIDERADIFVVGVLASVSPVLVSITARSLSIAPRNAAAAELGQFLDLIIMPAFLLGVLALGKRLTVLPEAHSLQTRGIYGISRHPLYACYIYTFIVQNLIFQSGLIVLLSIGQISLIWVRAKREEEILLRNFADYGDYMQKVTWAGRREWYRALGQLPLFHGGNARPDQVKSPD